MNTVVHVVNQQVRFSHRDETQINAIHYKTKSPLNTNNVPLTGNMKLCTV